MTVELPRKRCQQCEKHVISIISKAKFCGPCRNDRRTASRVQPWRHEQAATIERQLQAAKAARLAEERRTGQRRYTITDGWTQRAGRSTLDGDLRIIEVPE
jgi:hypothetical protein